LDSAFGGLLIDSIEKKNEEGAEDEIEVIYNIEEVEYGCGMTDIDEVAYSVTDSKVNSVRGSVI
jgi:hypothetical protein